jgi:peptidoglycan hydrolase-like protein with peptidoglycan-binding domain
MTPPTLKKGSHGEAVVGLQEGLQSLGYDPGAVDGIFGPNTEQAVKAFQTDRGLTADGIVGPRTWAALEEAFEEARSGG